MNKTVLALAVTGALSPLAATADTVNVDINIRLYPQYQTSKTEGATAAGTPVSTMTATSVVTGTNLLSRQEVNAQNSKITFRGDADIGAGMKGIWQVDQAVELDTGTGTWAAQDAYAGISSRFGTVYLGRFNTVYKELGEPVDFLGVKTSNFVSLSNILSKPGFSSSSRASFHLRRNNAVHYETPVFGGLQLQLDYSPDEGKTIDKNFSLYSYGAKWEAGPLYFALAQELHFDAFGGSSSGATIANPNTGATGIHSKDQAIRGTFGFKSGGTQVGFDLAQIEYHEYGNVPNGKFDRYKHNTWALAGEQRFGNVKVAASYGRAGAGTCALYGGTPCDTMGLDGKVINLGAAYDFGKRIQVHTLYSKMTNGTSGIYNNLNNGDVTAGADITQAAVGISIRM